LDTTGDHVFSLKAWGWRPCNFRSYWAITTGTALCERLSIASLPLDGDAEEDARIVTEKALESQEKDMVPEFSSMAIFDNTQPNTWIHPEK